MSLASFVRDAAGVSALVLGLSATAQAQDQVEQVEPIGEWSNTELFAPSPENFTLELRAGAYQPNLGSASSVFNGDLGPLVAVELDYHAFRIPYVGPIFIGGRVGWVEWTGDATSTSGATNVGSTGLSVVPFSALVGVRIDTLARNLSIPFVFTPKLGFDFGYHQTGTSGVTSHDGWSVGIGWGAQVALELDFLEPRSARRLDEEWGINHTQLFFELMGSTMGTFSNRQLPVGADLAWSAGLGFVF